MKQMFLNALRAQCLKALGLDTIILADLIWMISTRVGQGSDVDHGTVLNLGNCWQSPFIRWTVIWLCAKVSLRIHLIWIVFINEVYNSKLWILNWSLFGTRLVIVYSSSQRINNNQPKSLPPLSHPLSDSFNQIPPPFNPMKSNLLNPYQTANPKFPPLYTPETKFVYNKQKFSSP